MRPLLSAWIPAVLLGSVVLGSVPLEGADEAARKLERWLESYRRNGPDVGVEAVLEAQALADWLRAARRVGDGDFTAEQALLDLSGVRTNEELRLARRPGPEAAEVASRSERVRELGRAPLATFLAREGLETPGAGELASWLASSVLARSSQPLERRVAAAGLVAGRRLPATKLALFGCALEDRPELRAAALEALVGWPDEAVHGFLLERLEALEAGAEWPASVERSLFLRHFDTARTAPGGRAEERLLARVARDALGTDWRAAYRAIRTSRGLCDAAGVPALIAALSTWVDRRAADGGSLRIEHELLRELRQRSGRSLGPHPERWMAWWKASSAGSGEPSPAGEPPGLTQAQFFGLRPATDRVVFVLDRSGSMRTDFGARSRFGEAAVQMLAFLRALGPSARFNVVLFSSELETWRAGLQPATEANLAALERWLRYVRPNGGTGLEAAIRSVFELDSSGRASLARIEADSVVVLCDGETDEGPSWIRPLLESVNDEACLAFHGVQVGPVGDGALERLAELSGGDFVEVE